MQNKAIIPPEKVESVVLLVAIIALSGLCVLGIFVYARARSLPHLAVPSPTPPVTQTATLADTPGQQPTQTETPTSTPLPPPATPRPVSSDIEGLLGKMTLEQKAGQMVLGAVSAENASKVGASLIGKKFLGGFVVHFKNIPDLAQAAQIPLDLQTIASANQPAIPLFIAIDGESGAVALPSLMALGAAGSTDLAYQAGAETARQLQALGINLMIGPAVDLSYQPGSVSVGLYSFGSDPEKVSTLGRMYIAGLQENGIIAVARSFPGLGAADGRSQAKIPSINKPLAALKTAYLVPFSRVIDQKAGGILIGQISYPALEPQGLPASLAPALVDGLLRTDLSYQGVVITGDLSADAITSQYDPKEAVLQAIQAGCDIVMLSDPDQAASATGWIAAAVKSGKIPSERVDASVRRILTLKAQYNLSSNQSTRPAQENRTEAHQLALKIARRSIYARKPAVFPLLKPASLLLITPDIISRGNTFGDNLSLLGETLSGHGFSVDEWIYPVQDSAGIADIQTQALNNLSGAQAVVVVTFNAISELSAAENSVQDQLIQAAALAAQNAGIPIVLVAGGQPYDLNLFPNGLPALATFGMTDEQVEALANALLSGSPPPGKLPVELQP